MTRSSFVSCFTLLSLVLAADASAGYVNAPGVSFVEPYGQYDGLMSGSLAGARNAPNNLEYILCQRGICWMRDASGTTRTCRSWDEVDILKFDTVGPASFVSLYWQDYGWLGNVCQSVTIQNGSQYLP